MGNNGYEAEREHLQQDGDLFLEDQMTSLMPSIHQYMLLTLIHEGYANEACKLAPNQTVITAFEKGYLDKDFELTDLGKRALLWPPPRLMEPLQEYFPCSYSLATDGEITDEAELHDAQGGTHPD